MLSISPVNNINYYRDMASEDYYLRGGEPQGMWRGLGAQQLGLAGKHVKDHDYQNLMTGYSPQDDALVQNAGSEKRRNAWDLTFSAPKCVSLLWARCDDVLREQIQEVQNHATQSAIDFIERHAAITRRDKAGQSVERTAGLVVASFDHCSSRAQDFQLHTHALVCNLAPRFDGTWGSLESRRMYQWQKPAGAVYRAELASQLRKMGFQIAADEDSFCIEGIDKDLCNYFSKRSEAIEKELQKSGIRSSASHAGDNIKLMTRQHKTAVNRPALLARWQQELDTFNCTAELIDQIRSYQPTLPSERIEEELILDDITQMKATFSPQDIYYQVAVQATTAGLNAIKAERLANSILANESVVELKPEGVFKPRYTTQEVLDTERSMVNIAKHLASQSSKKITENKISNAVEKAESELGFKFDDEQQEAIFIALNGADFSIVQGSAGAGKTTLMLAAHHAYLEAGYMIKGACIAKKAADNLTAETGIESSTIASLITKIETGKNPLDKVDVLVVDEAGQLPSDILQQLMYCAKEATCKIILSGEDKQLDAISRGGSLRYLSRPVIIGTQRIENIRRQRSEWSRKTVANFRDGNANLALTSLKKHGCLHWADSSQETKQDLISHWYEYQKNNPEKNSLVMAQRWSDVKELSEIIRGIHIEEGRVGTENISLKCSVAEKQFDFEFSAGDRIKFCKNDYRFLKVSNGTLATIKTIHRLNDGDVHFTVVTDDKRNLTFLASEYSDERGTNLSLAYALTVYSAQGTTVDGNTFSYYTAGMDRSNTYVAASRHKDEAHIFCNRKEIDERTGALDSGRSISDKDRLAVLAGLMSRDRYSTLAIEHLLDKPYQQESKKSIEFECWN